MLTTSCTNDCNKQTTVQHQSGPSYPCQDPRLAAAIQSGHGIVSPEDATVRALCWRHRHQCTGGGVLASPLWCVCVQVLCPKVHGALHHLLIGLPFFGSASAGDMVRRVRCAASPCACGASRVRHIATRLPRCFLLPGPTRSWRVQASRHQEHVEGVGAADHCREGRLTRKASPPTCSIASFRCRQRCCRSRAQPRRWSQASCMH
jgi:hypothetical protein